MTDVKFLAFSGSSRTGSYNQRLIDLATNMARDAGATVTTINLKDFDLPIYDADMEAAAFPNAAIELKALFVSHSGFLIASPEYNGSISGLLKNSIDWVSRPTGGESPIALRAFRGKVAGLMGASIGPFGSLRSVLHLRQILGTVQTMVVTEQVTLPFADKAFDGPALVEDLPRQLLGGLVASVNALAGSLRQ